MAAVLADPDPAAQSAALLRRLESATSTSLLVKARIVMGMATFFDAFDALAIAFVLPVLVGLWHLAPAQIGLLIGAGFAGQAVGALAFGWLAERIGRVAVASITVALFALASLACAWADSFAVLLTLRVIQGIGLGGEVPAAAAYVNELTQAQNRGRFFMVYELVFPAGLLCAALVGTWMVPKFGWQSMFLLGAVPAVLALFMRRMLPESPRWLIARGRLAEARAVLDRLYRPATPEVAQADPLPQTNPTQETSDWRDILRGLYARRTVSIWLLWIFAYMITYGVTTWLPTVYRTVFSLPLPEALNHGMLTNVAGFLGAACCAVLIDRVGRVRWFMGAFLMGAICLGALYLQGATTATAVLVGASAAYFFIASCATALYLYTAELYPTRIRAFGVSAASAWLRVASAIGPVLVGATVARGGLDLVFGLFAAMALGGCFVTRMLNVETRGRALEQVSP